MALSTVSFLASCAQLTSSEVLRGSSVRQAIQNAGARGDYTELATYFKRTAEEMRVKANEQKKLLQQYENQYFYGWQRHNLTSHTSALIREYEKAAAANMEEAAFHRQMNSLVGERDRATRPELRSGSNRGEVSRN